MTNFKLVLRAASKGLQEMTMRCKMKMDHTVLAAYFLHPVCLWGLSTVASDALSSIRPINAASTLQASTQCEVLVPTNRLACRSVARKCLTDEIENFTSHVAGTWTAVNSSPLCRRKKAESSETWKAPGKWERREAKWYTSALHLG